MNNTERYLQLLKKCLLNTLYPEDEGKILFMASKLFMPGHLTQEQLKRGLLNIESTNHYEANIKTKKTGGFFALHSNIASSHVASSNTASSDVASAQGTEITEFRNFAFLSHSMIGTLRMNQLHQALDVIRLENIPGDWIETGVWRGGATIFMAGYRAAHDLAERRIWVADSFAGLPKPGTDIDQPNDFSAGMFPYLCVPEDEVRKLFARYELLDEAVHFLKGWFKDSLPGAPIEQLALLRLDGDLYESTMDALRALYHKVSPGGVVIVDDYFSFPGCREAVDCFRREHSINDALRVIDPAAVYWRKGLQ